MANRCPDCNKFVGLETQDPEVNDIDVSETSIILEVRVTRNCADCGTEMKSNDFSTEVDLPQEWIDAHGLNEDGTERDGHGEWEVEEGSSSQYESGGGRYAKNMVGYDLTAKVTCKCGESVEVEVHDEEAASFFNDEV